MAITWQRPLLTESYWGAGLQDKIFLFLNPENDHGPPLWSSGQSCWLQIQRSEFDSRRYQFFWEVVGLERGPLSLVSTIEEQLGSKSSTSGLEIRDYGRRDPSCWPRGILYPQKLPLTSPTSGSRAVGIVRSRTQATELSCYGSISSFGVSDRLHCSLPV
jgi:hypothetical protein